MESISAWRWAPRGGRSSPPDRGRQAPFLRRVPPPRAPCRRDLGGAALPGGGLGPQGPAPVPHCLDITLDILGHKIRQYCSMERTYERTHPWLNFSLNLLQAPHLFWMALGEIRSKCEHILIFQKVMDTCRDLCYSSLP